MRQWLPATFVPVTAAGPSPILTEFPFSDAGLTTIAPDIDLKFLPISGLFVNTDSIHETVEKACIKSALHRDSAIKTKCISIQVY